MRSNVVRPINLVDIQMKINIIGTIKPFSYLCVTEIEMRKSLTILFLFFYTLATAEIGINFHYCLGELAQIEIFSHGVGCCCGGEEEMTNCCDDQSFSLQIDENQQTPSSSIIVQIPVDEIPGIWKMDNESRIFTQKASFTRYFEKVPPTHKQPIWLLNSNFIYYG